MSTIDRAVTLAIESKPDLVCLTGDFITNRYDFDYDAYVRVLRRLSAAAPVYGVLGNHDGGVWAARNFGYADHRVVEKLIDESGIELLHNRSISIQAGGEPLSLVGVGDLQSGEINAQQAFAGVPANQPTILLSHNPDSKTVVCAHAWELMLSGHTHGGQVIVPFLGPRYAPVRDKRYVAPEALGNAPDSCYPRSGQCRRRALPLPSGGQCAGRVLTGRARRRRASLWERVRQEFREDGLRGRRRRRGAGLHVARDYNASAPHQGDVLLAI